MSATPTDGERNAGLVVVSRLPISLGDYRTRDLESAAAVIAQALADQRAKYEAVADELDESCVDFAAFDAGAGHAAERIRQVAR